MNAPFVLVSDIISIQLVYTLFGENNLDHSFFPCRRYLFADEKPCPPPGLYFLNFAKPRKTKGHKFGLYHIDTQTVKQKFTPFY